MTAMFGIRRFMTLIQPGALTFMEHPCSTIKAAICRPAAVCYGREWKKLYKKEIAARYFELRESVLNTDHIMKEFNDFQNSIPKEVLERETAKWNTKEKPIPGYPISQIEKYLSIVVPRLDAKYEAWK